MPRSGAVVVLLLSAIQFVAVGRASAAVKDFPYEAVVQTDDALVRCGPGKNYYPTLNLKRGARVAVRRHDPGGWFMIEPPEGSFSLIRADDVVPEGRDPNRGTVKRLDQGQASVRIGSSLDPNADSIFQMKLSSGQHVDIVGEVTIQRKGQPIEMLKIRPPKGEFRWIEGKCLVPLAGDASPGIEDKAADPFGAPPQARSQPGNARSPNRAMNPNPKTIVDPNQRSLTSRRAEPGPPMAAGPPAFDPFGRLDQIDRQFRDMIRQPPPTWNLAQVEQSYRELQKQTADAGIQPQVETRLSAVDHYKDVKREYDDYFRLASQTAQTDAQLAAIQNSYAPQSARPVAPPFAAAPPIPFNTMRPRSGPSGVPTLSMQQSQAPSTTPAPASPSQSDSTPANGPILGSPIPQPNIEAAPFIPVPTEPPSASSDAPSPRAPSNGPAPSPKNPATPQPTPGTTLPPRAPAGRGTSPLAPSRLRQPGNVQSSPAGSPGENLVPDPSVLEPAQQGTVNRSSPLNRPMRNTDPSRRFDRSPAVQDPARDTSGSSLPSVPQVRRYPQGAAPPPMAPPRQVRPPGGPALDGAGIIQRAAAPVNGAPRHVLLAPNGRILAYLQAERGVNLDAYLGRPMGLMGRRAYRPELQADLIVVRGMVPVRLVP